MQIIGLLVFLPLGQAGVPKCPSLVSRQITLESVVAKLRNKGFQVAGALPVAPPLAGSRSRHRLCGFVTLEVVKNWKIVRTVEIKSGEKKKWSTKLSYGDFHRYSIPTQGNGVKELVVEEWLKCSDSKDFKVQITHGPYEVDFRLTKNEAVYLLIQEVNQIVVKIKDGNEERRVDIQLFSTRTSGIWFYRGR